MTAPNNGELPLHRRAGAGGGSVRRAPGAKRVLPWRFVRCCLIGIVGAALMMGCFPRMPTNPAAQQSAATDASFSPDGSTILFAANHDGDLEIYVVAADGSDRRQLTDNGGQDFFPSWSPDGNTIVFSSDRSGAVELYLMDADGGNQRPLMAEEG